MPNGTDDRLDDPAFAAPSAARFAPLAEHHAFSSQAILSYYPAPIAVAYRRFCDYENPTERVLNLFAVAEAVLRYLVTLAVSDLFHCLAETGGPGAQLPDSDAFAFLRGPERMQLGRWVAALREAGAALGEHPHRFLTDLPALADSRGPVLAVANELVSQRNRCIHEDAGRSVGEDECVDLLPLLRPKLEALLQTVRFLGAYPLGFARRGLGRPAEPGLHRYYFHSCMGARIADTQHAPCRDTPLPLAEDLPFLVKPDGSQLLYLWPLLLQRVARVSGRRTLYVFEEIRNDRWPWLTQVRSSAIDVADSWHEKLAPQPSGSHDWLLERLRQLPAAPALPSGLGLAEALLPTQRGQLVNRSLRPGLRLRAALAAGGFGTIYAAEDTDTEGHVRQVAVKVLEVQDVRHELARFEQEFRKLEKAGRHPGIIRCFEYGIAQLGGREYPWYSMEFALGDLTSRIDARKSSASDRVPWDDLGQRQALLREFRAVAEAVAHLHSLGIVHRDVKPGNVLLMGHGELRLSDFGLVKDLNPSERSLALGGKSSTAGVKGTLDYMAPEQFLGRRVGKPADVYALGILLAELATGRRPRKPDSYPRRGSSTLRRWQPLKRLPAEVRELLEKCTQVDPADRPPDAQVVLQLFAEFMASLESVDAGKTPLPQPLPIDDAATGVGRVRPAPLDCTGEAGLSAAAVQQAQAAWARYLGRQVEEEVEVAPGVRMKFVLVPPGKFRMGSPEGEQDRRPNEVQHEVEITRPFYLGKYPVTQAQYEAVTEKNPSRFKGPDLPVESVSWDEASAYADTLTKKGSAGLLYRLPTEAEWEYSCRGGRSSSQPFGVGDGRALSSREANFDGNYPYGGAEVGPYLKSTSRVGSYPANALGLHDLHGNVWEWCADWYGEYAPGQATDPSGPGPGSSRVFRGGSWYRDAWSCRAAVRLRFVPGLRYGFLGARLARSFPSGAK